MRTERERAIVKVYQHIMIILSLVLFMVFFYQDGFGSIAFLIAAIYLVFIFISEMRRYNKNKEV